jgi:hypothetical protein
MSGGTLTQIMTAAINFPQGSYRRVRVTMIGGVITAYFEGTQILTYTDSSPIASGQCGLRNNSGTSYCYQLRVQPLGQAVTGTNTVNTRLILATTDPTVTPQVLDVATLVAGPSLGVGALIPPTTYQATICSTNIDDLRTQSDYFWTIDNTRLIWFQPRVAQPAPWVLASLNATTLIGRQMLGDVQVANLKVEYSGDLYRNRETLINVQAQETFEQKFEGDGTSTTWTLDYPIAPGTMPFLSLNGASQLLLTVGIKGQSSGKDYYYTPGGTGISQDASQSVLQPNETLVVTYTGTYTDSVTVNNTGGFPGTTTQAQYAAIDGTSGIVEHVTDCSTADATKNFTVADATAYGNALLQNYGVIGRTITFDTYRAGLAAGQALPVFLPQHVIQNAQTLLTQVAISAFLGVDGSGASSIQYKYSVTACEGPSLGDWVRLVGGVFA